MIRSAANLKTSPRDSFQKIFLELVQRQSVNRDDAKFQMEKLQLYWEHLKHIPLQFLERVAQQWPNESRFMISQYEWREKALQLQTTERGQSAGYADMEADYQRLLQYENDMYARILSLPGYDKQMILEQAHDMVEDSLVKLEKTDEDGNVIMSSNGQLAKLLRRHQTEAEKGVAIQIYKEDFLT